MENKLVEYFLKTMKYVVIFEYSEYNCLLLAYLQANSLRNWKKKWFLDFSRPSGPCVIDQNV